MLFRERVYIRVQKRGERECAVCEQQCCVCAQCALAVCVGQRKKCRKECRHASRREAAEAGKGKESEEEEGMAELVPRVVCVQAEQVRIRSNIGVINGGAGYRGRLGRRELNGEEWEGGWG